MSKKRTKVIVAGHACLDITPMFPRKQETTVDLEKGDAKTQPAEQEVSPTQLMTRLLAPGKLVQMKGVDINPGGAVSNTGLAMKLLGEDVALAAKIGEDSFGDILAGIYEKYGAASGIIRCKGERTSYSVVLAVPGVDRIFLHDPGANDTFDLEDIKKLDFSEVKHFHFGYPPIMEKMYRDGGSELESIFRYVKEQGVITSLDMTMVDENSVAGQADWDAILRKVLPYVDFFVPSVEETCFMLDRERYHEWCQRAGGEDLCTVIAPGDVKPLADRLVNYGAKVVLLKCGAPGLYYKTCGKAAMAELEPLLCPEKFSGQRTNLGSALQRTDLCSVLQWADQEGFENSYKPTRVLSGTGAGDTTIAAFLTAMLRGYDLHTAVKLAAAEGASSVEDYGALGGIRTLEELEQKIAAGWEKNR